VLCTPLHCTAHSLGFYALKCSALSCCCTCDQPPPSKEQRLAETAEKGKSDNFTIEIKTKSINGRLCKFLFLFVLSFSLSRKIMLRDETLCVLPVLVDNGAARFRVQSAF